MTACASGYKASDCFVLPVPPTRCSICQVLSKLTSNAGQGHVNLEDMTLQYSPEFDLS